MKKLLIIMMIKLFAAPAMAQDVTVLHEMLDTFIENKIEIESSRDVNATILIGENRSSNLDYPRWENHRLVVMLGEEIQGRLILVYGDANFQSSEGESGAMIGTDNRIIAATINDSLCLIRRLAIYWRDAETPLSVRQIIW